MVLGLGRQSSSDKEIRLPNPQITTALAQLINNRESIKTFNGKKFNEQTVSDVLWAAFGKNKKDTRTIPTAMNEKNLKVFVLDEDGVWLYMSDENRLKQISDENVLSLVALQDYVKEGALNLVFTGSDREYSPLHAGSAYQNVYLYAQDKGLATVVRAFIDKEKLKKALKLEEDEFVIIHQVVGNRVEKD